MPKKYYGSINCLYCGSQYKLINNREKLTRKYCSKSCKSLHQCKLGKLPPKVTEKTKINWIISGRNARLRKIMLNGGASWARSHCGGRETKIEKLTKEFLNNLSIKFESEKIINNHSVDIFIEPNIIIECDGKYWHSFPHIIEKDNKFNFWCKENNYIIIRLKEDDINNKNFNALEGIICQNVL